MRRQVVHRVPHCGYRLRGLERGGYPIIGGPEWKAADVCDRCRKPLPWAGREAIAGALTADSSSEQERIGFTKLAPAEFARVTGINRRFREKFGFPCIVALMQHATRDTVIADMEARIANDTNTEVDQALEQIGYISRARLARKYRQ